MFVIRLASLVKEGFTVSLSEDGNQSPEGKEKLQIEKKHKEEGYKEVFRIPAWKGEHSKAVLP